MAGLHRVLDHLGAPWNPDVLAVVERPSGRTVSGSAFLAGDLVNGYKRQLDGAQIDTITAVLADYGRPFDLDRPPDGSSAEAPAARPGTGAA